MAIDVQGEPVDLSARKGLALIAYLCRRAGSRVPRETLVGLLWGDRGDKQARASLRQTLSVLRKALGPSFTDALATSSNALELRLGAVDVDANRFEAAADGRDIDVLERACAHYRGEFLEGLGGVAREFDLWADAERASLRSTFVAALLRLTDAYDAADRTEEMIASAKRLLSLDPLQEHVHRRLMAAYRRQKRFDMALKQFAELRQRLADELGVSPEAPTLALVKEINAARGVGESPPSPSASPPDRGVEADPMPAAPNRPSIAILAFRSLTDHPEAAYFGEGIAEDVIIELSREASLLVVSRQSSFRFDTDSHDIVDIGRQLGVRFLLTGTIRLMGNQARVTAHLVRCDDNSEVWADRYDRDLSDLFEIQADIARTVTGTVVGRIAEAEIERARGRPAENLDAYLLVLRGINHMHTLSRQDFDQAIDLFDWALGIDPNHGRALGLKAMTMIYRRWYFDIDTAVDDAIDLAQAALKVDRRDPKAHCALGVGHMLSRDFSRARYHFEAGLTANPNDDLLLIEYGRFLMYVDRAEEGLMRIREAMRLNPFHPNWYWNMMGRCLHTLGRYDEAIDAFQRIVDPPFYIHAYLAACHARRGDGPAAAAARQRLLQARPDFDLERFTQVLPYQNEKTREAYLDSLRDAGLG